MPCLGPPLIIMELCENGNLLAFLREKHRLHLAKQKRFKDMYGAAPGSTPHNKEPCKRTLSDGAATSRARALRRKKTSGELPWPIPVTEMLRMAFQVASGMEYLQSRKVCLKLELLLTLTGHGPYILESVIHDEFAFIKKGGFPYVKYGNNWHVKG